MKLNCFPILLLLLPLIACSATPPQAFSTPVSTATAVEKAETSKPAVHSLGDTPTPTEAPHQTATNTPGGISDQPGTEVNPSIPDPGNVSWMPVVENLTKPVGVSNAGDGSGRLFILEQEGTIRIVSNGALHPNPYIDIRDRVGANSSERGLLGLAFHPNYSETGYFYVNYTNRQGDTVISRFQVSGSDANTADPSSEKQLLKISQPFANHNGGSVMFGPDGYLYLGTGDGGSGGDPKGNGQKPSSLLGKILRIDVDSESVDDGEPYAIPMDNAFASSGGAPEVWAYGLRNPWRFSFDRQTGDLYIGDVGQNEWEEIDYLAAGSDSGTNFGWNFMEGSHPYQGKAPDGLVNPVFEYNHSQGCSVTGGVVYRGTQLPDWNGVYLFGDFCSGNVWGLIRSPDGSWEGRLLFKGLGSISSFGEDETGEIYSLTYNGSLLKLSSSTP